MRKYLLLFIFFLFFLTGNVAFAGVLPDQENLFDNATIQWGYNNNNDPYYLCQSFMPTTNSVAQVLVKMARVSAVAPADCDHPPSVYILNNTHGCNMGWGATNQLGHYTMTRDECLSKIPTTTPAYVSFYFDDSPITITPATTTWAALYWSGSFTGGMHWINAYQNTDVYASGVMARQDQTGSVEYPNYDLMFVEAHHIGPASTTTAQVVISEPQFGSTYTAAEIATIPFTVYINYPSNEKVLFEVALYDYSASSTVPIYGQVFEQNTTVAGYNAWSAPWPNAFINGSYGISARATFMNTNYITPWSAVVNFTVSDNTIGLNLQCSSTDLVCMIEKGFVWAMVPSNEFITTNASSTYANFLGRWPFNGLTTVYNGFSSLDSISSSTPPTKLAEFRLPALADATITIPFLQFQDPDLAGFFSTVRTLLTYVAWFFYCLWIFHEVTSWFHPGKK